MGSVVHDGDGAESSASSPGGVPLSGADETHIPHPQDETQEDEEGHSPAGFQEETSVNEEDAPEITESKEESQGNIEEDVPQDSLSMTTQSTSHGYTPIRRHPQIAPSVPSTPATPRTPDIQDARREESPVRSVPSSPPTGGRLLSEQASQRRAVERLARQQEAVLRKREQIYTADRMKEVRLMARDESIAVARAQTSMSKKEKVRAVALKNSVRQKEAKQKAHNVERAYTDWAAGQKRSVDSRLASVEVIEKARVDCRSQHAQGMLREQMVNRAAAAQMDAEAKREEHEAYVQGQRRAAEVQDIASKATLAEEEKVRVLRVGEKRSHEDLKQRMSARDRREDLVILEKDKSNKERARAEAFDWAQAAMPARRKQASGAAASSSSNSSSAPSPKRIPERQYQQYNRTRYSSVQGLSEQVMSCLPTPSTNYAAEHAKKGWKR